MEINEIIEKQVKTWQEKDNEKRSVIVIATEDLADNKNSFINGYFGKGCEYQRGCCTSNKQ